MENFKALSKGEWFCCTDCNKIHTSLDNLVAVGLRTLPETSLDAIKKTHVFQFEASPCSCHVSHLYWNINQDGACPRIMG
ncbi:hypothetical protein HanIR_Chr14g0682971 [Helianthus annuus]|nr:hypothetical protein HanIR_Chr14g0682971 [Helianthus annuus]